MQQIEETSLFIKLVFKKEVFNLGKNIKAYSDLATQLKSRFAGTQNYQLTFNEQPVTKDNFQQILMTQLKQGQKSIKLELTLSPLKNIIETKESKSKKFSFDPKDFEDEKQVSQKQEKVKDLENEFQQLKVNESQVNEPSKVQIDLDTIKIKVLMGDQLSSIKMKVGEEFTWSCTLINQNSIQVPKGVYLRQISTNKLIDIGGMGAKQAEQIKFGPYIEKEAGKFTRFFQIVYKKSEQVLLPIGNKFGFVCEASKKLTVKELQNQVYTRVEAIKSFSACQKSTEYIVAKFKEIGIDEFSVYQYADEDLIDMMESFNEQP